MAAVRYDGQITTTAKNVARGKTASVMTVPYAIVTVYNYPNVLSLAGLFQDQALTVPIANPITADSFGRFGFWTANGTYGYIAVDASGNALGSFPITFANQGPPGVAGSPGTITSDGVTGGFEVAGAAGLTAQISNLSTTLQFPAYSSTYPVYEIAQQNTAVKFTGAGWNFGNNGGWSVSKGLNGPPANFSVRGIKQVYSQAARFYGEGDQAGIYWYLNPCGGIQTASDEGVTAITMQIIETPYFRGTVTATSGLGDITPKFTRTAGEASAIDGGIALNISKGTIAGNLNGASTSFSPTLPMPYATPLFNQLPVTGVTLPLTTAWGTVVTAISIYSSADTNTPITVAVTLGMIGGTAHPFIAGGVVTVAGSYNIEQANILSVGAVSGGIQNITIAVRNPNPQAYIFQGGIQGQYLSFDANLALSGFRSSYFVLGSLTGSDMIYARYVGGRSGDRPLPQTGQEAATTTGANSGFHLYPGAETVAIRAVDVDPLQIQLEPNKVNWALGDVVETPHGHNMNGNSLWINKICSTVSEASFDNHVARFDLSGPNAAGQTKNVGIYNSNPFSSYSGFGGALGPPRAIHIEGLFDSLIEIITAPLARLFNILNFGGSAPIQLFSFPNGSISWNTSGATGMTSSAPIAAPSFTVGVTPGFTGVIPAGSNIQVSGGIITGYS